jgi:uncharacterized protein (TIGR00251 family)
MSFLSVARDDTVLLHLYVQPKSSKTRVIGLYDGLLKIGVTSPPVDGKANRELINFLAKCLKIPKSDIILKSGKQSRRKTFRIFKIGEKEVRRIFMMM